MILEEVVQFLQEVPPFQFLDDETLRGVASSVFIEFFPKGAVILSQEGPASDFLRIVKKGGVKVYVRSGDDEEVIIDYRSEGDAFGFLSLVSGDKSRANVTAVEDTICYSIDKKTITSLLDSKPAFTEFFLKSFLSKYIDRTFTEMHSKSLLYGGGDRQLFTTHVGDLAARDVETAPPDITIREAAERMSMRRISSLVITGEDGVPAGIVTDRDLRDKVVAKARSVDDRISSIMSVSLIKVEARDYCFEALLKMIRYNIHHLLVVQEGRLKGVVTNHDLMMLQGTSPISLAREIEGQQSIDGLIPASKKINKMITLLLKEGATANNITRIISEINDRMVRKILEMTEKKHGKPPLPYCWIVFGSEGRKEQTFKTDQDNAIIYADPPTDSAGAAADAYFERFTADVNDALVRCGFPPCPGGYMASNQKWRRPLRIWKQYFADWIHTPTPEAILASVILFDFRALHGDTGLADELWEYLGVTLKDQDIFLKYMANLTISVRPPLGFFKTFVVEKSGEHKDKLNLKFKCIAPLLNIVRLYSLEKGVTETSTLDRIDALRAIHRTVAEFGDEFAQAFEFITLLRIHHQFDQIELGKEPDNFIDPEALTNLEKKALKEVCQLISRTQDSIAKQYNPGMTM
ncbi:MAG: hypothetical protein A2X56_02920 [Nitrospirae bacterium GWC2_57_13]|jgi:CBS domain-containing protein|nr:MAG: hypothetical protein A2072_04490 [Nitrospirae bacterium GWC1_57_7]OGW28349.1 MAG: hypothetical protein A2X56_02920 [Nitrospirae bacterium GWC2_57_13]OGW42310.1 MAG: hypothetical protein A2X57_08730 [Nitrospirae bacterium GWD2_57_8]HAR45113.1 histidine kinase [Nitrospiraceae bacterium]